MVRRKNNLDLLWLTILDEYDQELSESITFWKDVLDKTHACIKAGGKHRVSNFVKNNAFAGLFLEIAQRVMERVWRRILEV